MSTSRRATAFGTGEAALLDWLDLEQTFSTRGGIISAI
jgi:hypothetical protein